MPSKKELDFSNDLEYRIHRINHLAEKYSWNLRLINEDRFDFINKQEQIITVHYKELKVITTLKHPKWGRTTLKREGNITERIMELIFRNPRVHIRKNLKVKSSYLNT